MGWVAAIAATLLFMGGDGAIAQESATEPSEAPPAIEEPSATPPPLDASTIPSAKVSQFVQAYVQVLDLLEQRQGEVKAAASQLEAKQLEGEIEAQALDIIEGAGLTQQEYLQLLSLANVDPEFGERIANGLEEARETETGEE
ncbi:DUF4168 domain-containing protein [Oxynema aestuarii]|nr:DUF4168 domain-containing protein [Oxynema aestuarii]